MVIKPLTRKLLRDLLQRHTVLSALILILAIGICCYVGMTGVYYDLDTAKINYYRANSLADFSIELKHAPESLEPYLQKTPNVAKLRTRLIIPAMVNLVKKYNQIPIPAVAVSMPAPRREVINNIKLFSGRWFSGQYAHEVILNQQFANVREIHVGDHIKVRLPDKEHTMLVVGTAFSPEYTMIIPPGGGLAPDPGGYAVLFMPRQFLQKYTNSDRAFNELIGLANDRSDTALYNTMNLLSDRLSPYGVQLKIPRNEQFPVELLDDELHNIKSTVIIFPSMFLLVAILVLNVMLSRLVVQQRSIIGTLKAIGYNKISIVRHYLSYGVIIGLIGGIIGIGLGILLETVMLINYKIYFSIPDMQVLFHPSLITVGLLLSIVSSASGALTGAYISMRLVPAEAMRPPAPEKGSHVFLEKFPQLWKSVPFKWKMIARSISRNRVRSIVTIIAGIMATSILFSSLEFLDSIDKMVRFSFDLVQHQDYNLTLRDPVGPHVLPIIRKIPGVLNIEGQLNVYARLSNPPYFKRLTVTGIPADNVLFTPVDKIGNPITIPKSGLVLTKTLASILHVKAGEYITLQPLLGSRKIVRAKIISIVPTYLGLSAYANQRWLSRLLGNSWLSDTFLLKLYPNINHSLFSSRISNFATMIGFNNINRSKSLFIYSMNEFMTFFIIIAIIFAAIISIGAIVNTAMISLNEREHDIACLRVIGLSTYEITQIFSGESSILNCLGILLGLGGGIFLAYLTGIAFNTNIYRIPVVITFSRLFETVVFMSIFVIIAQFIIYYIIRRIEWFDILNTRE